MSNIKKNIIKFFSKKHIRFVIILFFAMQILINVLSFNIDKQTYNIEYYTEYSKKNNVKNIAGVSQEKLEEMYTKLVLYTEFGNESLLNDFNEREIMHMRDVHELYMLKNSISLKNITLVFLTIIILSGSKKIKHQNLKYLIISLLSILVFLGIIGFTIYLDFDKAFIRFHELFFNNDLWILDPKTDIMIRMLPQEYFMNVALNIFKGFIINIFLIIILLLIVLLFEKNTYKKA